MLLEILTVGALGVVILFLWKIFDILVRMGTNQCDQATFAMQELELIRAGLFAMTRIKGGEGWPEFDKMSHCIAKENIRPARLASVLRAEGKTQEQINDYIAAARRLEEEGEG
jgi:cobalamin biosynthesis Co2+ chelatase CbiK